jgi:hypothetical protein
MTNETQHVTPALIDAGRLAAIIDGLTHLGSGSVTLELRANGEWLAAATKYSKETDVTVAFQYGSTAREAIDRMLTETRWSQ